MSKVFFFPESIKKRFFCREMEIVRCFYVMVLFMIGWQHVCFAEKIFLKTGKTIEGKIVEKTDRFVKLDFYNTILTYYTNEIERIEGVESYSAGPESKNRIVFDEGEKEKLKNDGFDRSRQHITVGIRKALQKQYPEAKRLFEKVLKIDSGNLLARISVQVLEDVIRKNISEDIAFSLFQGSEYYDKDMFRDAVTFYSQVIESHPALPEAYFFRAIAYFDEGLYEQAMNDYTKVIELKPRYMPLAYYSRGLVYNLQRLYDKAIDDFTRAIETDATDFDVYIQRGITYFKKGSYKEAIRDYTEVIAVSPKKNAKIAEVYAARANIYNATGRYDEAIADYTKALAINAVFVDAFFNRGLTHFKKGDYEKAIADYDSVIRLNPQETPAYINKAFAYEKAGFQGEAIKAYKEFVRRAPLQYVSDVEWVKERIQALEK